LFQKFIVNPNRPECLVHDRRRRRKREEYDWKDVLVGVEGKEWMDEGKIE
jgi:hypothetical protein